MTLFGQFLRIGAGCRYSRTAEKGSSRKASFVLCSGVRTALISMPYALYCLIYDTGGKQCFHHVRPSFRHECLGAERAEGV